MSCAIAQGFTLDCRDSSGGLVEAYIAEFDAITVTEAAGVVTAIAKASGKQFFRFQQVKQTADATEAVATSEENGTVAVTQTINLVMNKLQATTRNMLDTLIRNRLIVVGVDKNGAAWLYGWKGAVNATAVNAATGKMLADRNGYTATLTGMEPFLAPSVQTSLIAALTTPGT